jgi:4-aminobutyrate aminotransferase
VQAASHQGDPFQCSVALANLDVIEEEDLLANAARMGHRLAHGLADLAARHRIVGDARGLGLIAGLETLTMSRNRRSWQQRCPRHAWSEV